MAKKKSDDGVQDQGSLNQPVQAVEDERGEWTPEDPYDRVADVPVGDPSGGPVNPVLDDLSANEVEDE